MYIGTYMFIGLYIYTYIYICPHLSRTYFLCAVSSLVIVDLVTTPLLTRYLFTNALCPYFLFMPSLYTIRSLHTLPVYTYKYITQISSTYKCLYIIYSVILIPRKINGKKNLGIKKKIFFSIFIFPCFFFSTYIYIYVYLFCVVTHR